MRRRLLTLASSSSQASDTLAIGATAWLLSGLTPSPLLLPLWVRQQAAGSPGMGLIAQLIGLGGSLPIQLAAFLGAGILLPLLQRRRP